MNFRRRLGNQSACDLQPRPGTGARHGKIRGLEKLLQAMRSSGLEKRLQAMRSSGLEKRLEAMRSSALEKLLQAMRSSGLEKLLEADRTLTRRRDPRSCGSR